MTFPRRFCWYELRTTDPVAAATFYADLGVPILASRGIDVVPLPAPARARGAPAHWLGHVGVADVDATASELVGRGGERLGPPRLDADGTRVAVLRERSGAILALTSRAPLEAAAVGWHELYARDRAAAWATYAELFGWRTTATVASTPVVGTYQTFAWHDGGAPVGGAIETIQMPGVHAQWAFYLAVDDLDRAIARVTAGGGRLTHGPAPHPCGGRGVTGEDPQGAAFALCERRSPAP